ncbi:MAG TPA: zinc-binding dehydrogenase [Gemmatimonadales bacterium]|jgi:NADPH:quinone reductase-like Zn-dependent oxidoreductase|nr:zinc-binding dehydrogenase [Gemmatimonadales bacterium]
MKALVLTAPGGLKQLRVQELPTPHIESPDQVLVQVKAGALNHLDLFVADGLPGVTYSFPHIVGSDGAGTVHEVGSAVRQLRLGARVMVNPTISCGECPACTNGEESLCSRIRVLGEHCSGTIAEYIVVPAGNLAPVPEEMPWAEAAAFSLATLTAWRMLVTRARLEAGETVLIVGIGGGVALAALQIALLRGARTIVTSGSHPKLELARRMGAEFALQHNKDDVPAAVREITAGRGADVVVDNAGERSWQASLRSLRRGGRLVTCGATTGPFVTLDLRRLFWHQWSFLGSTLGSRREYAEIVSLARQGRLWPIIDRVVPLDQSLDAFERLQRGEQTGKLVIEVAP